MSFCGRKKTFLQSLDFEKKKMKKPKVLRDLIGYFGRFNSPHSGLFFATTKTDNHNKKELIKEKTSWLVITAP